MRLLQSFGTIEAVTKNGYEVTIHGTPVRPISTWKYLSSLFTLEDGNPELQETNLFVAWGLCDQAPLIPRNLTVGLFLYLFLGVLLWWMKQFSRLQLRNTIPRPDFARPVFCELAIQFDPLLNHQSFDRQK